MIKETLRSLTEQERQCLQERATTKCPVSGRDIAKWVLFWVGGLFLLALLAAGLIMLHLNPVFSGICGGILFVAGIICLYALIVVFSSFFHWSQVYRDFSKDKLPAILRVLEEGKVLSKDVISSEVYEIEEFEDEGPGYIFAIGDGKSLLLKGQKYTPEEDQMPWPSRDFSIVRSCDGELWIGLFSSGETLPPSRIVKMEECKDEFVWSEQEKVLEGLPEDILKGITKSC